MLEELGRPADHHREGPRRGASGTAAGQGFVKQGAGTLVLTSTDAGAAASVVNGVLNVAAGTLQMNRTGASAAASGDLTASGITGSGTIQEQFMHHLGETPQFKKTTTSESTSNPMSDDKLVEFVTSHFKN